MSLTGLKPHRAKLLLLAVIANTTLVASLILGDVKTWGEIDWLDVFGEGGTAAMLLTWLIFILRSRPAGRVSTILTAGFGLVFLALWQDNLDEFIRFANSQWWDTWLESVPLPIGMLLVTWGMYHWHQEQLVIQDQLRGRELSVREHRQVDSVTKLSRSDYLKSQIETELQSLDDRIVPPSLLMVDVDGFDLINREYGTLEGDRLLKVIGELLLMNVRRHDLVCRFAGDRFAILLPGTGEAAARLIASEISDAVAHLAHKSAVQGNTIPVSVSVGVAQAKSSDATELMERANRSLAQAKGASRKEYAA
ncbi:GGDEF domain-containing protein [Marinobacter lacisalsi]|uniref:diguanylate cyclase n=1 Tax=Marinobacter lacisalsi TaxID=475979 RepID=A0ABV8QL74_9GAMM